MHILTHLPTRALNSNQVSGGMITGGERFCQKEPQIRF